MSQKNTILTPKESDIQIQVADWLRDKYPHVLFTAGLGGLRLSVGQAVKIKRMGYRNGTPDLQIWEPTESWRALFIELKREKGIASKEQRAFQIAAMKRRYLYEICYGYGQTIATIKNYLEQICPPNSPSKLVLKSLGRLLD